MQAVIHMKIPSLAVCSFLVLLTLGKSKYWYFFTQVADAPVVLFVQPIRTIYLFKWKD